MFEQDSSHLRWEVPPAARAAAGPAPSEMVTTAAPQGRWRRRSRRHTRRHTRGRGLLVAALACLLIGGGASGVAFAADGAHGADSGRGPDRAGFTSGDRGGHADAAVDAVDGARAARRG